MPADTATPYVRATRTATVTEFEVGAPFRWERRVWALARLSIGWVFLWAFLDKLLGLGFATPPERAWLAGGSPTRGFLGNSTGPLAGFFQGLAGDPAVDALFMVGLLAIGAALLLGIGLRIAAATGGLLLVLMWAASPPATNPFMDDHIVYALVLAGLALARAGDTWGLGLWWARRPAVRRRPWLE